MSAPANNVRGARAREGTGPFSSPNRKKRTLAPLQILGDSGEITKIDTIRSFCRNPSPPTIFLTNPKIQVPPPRSSLLAAKSSKRGPRVEVFQQRSLLAVLEAADRDPSLIAKGALNFVIVGAGATGAEVAGTLGDLMHRVLKDEYPGLPLNEVRIILVDNGSAILSAFSPKAQTCSVKMLEERGVEIRLHTAVKEVASGHVVLSDETSIRTHTVIWAGGLKASSLSARSGDRQFSFPATSFW